MAEAKVGDDFIKHEFDEAIREIREVAPENNWDVLTFDMDRGLSRGPGQGDNNPDPINAGRELAALGGLPSRTELVAAYTDAGGRPVGHLDWYVAMACFKLAIVIEGTYSRYLVGQAHREAGERLHDSANRLIELGGRVAAGDNPFT